jgi:hypothetical protein
MQTVVGKQPMKTTDYYTTNVVVRRPYLKEEWIRHTLENPVIRTRQSNGRIRHWAYIAEAEKYLRVVTEADGETVHNAFFDRRFKPPS